MADTINNFGQFLPTTFILDVDILDQIDVRSPQFRELLVRQFQLTNSIIEILNVKDSGYYPYQEFVTGKVYNPQVGNDFENQGRAVFRRTINFGALPAAGTKSLPHAIPNINTAWRVTDYYGAGTNPAILEAVALPYPSTIPANILEVWVDSVNVNVRTGGKDYSQYLAEIVVEYTKYL